MRVAAALSGRPTERFSIDEVELDDPRSDEVLVRLVASGICHTDLMMRTRWPPEKRPFVLGHEGAGVVESVGDAVTSVQRGDHVLMSFSSCSACVACRRGHPAYCTDFRTLNLSGCRRDGSTTMQRGGQPVYGSFFGQSSFASHAITYEANLVRVHPDRDLSVLAPLGCGVQTGAGSILNVLRPDVQSALVVFGAGGVGLAAVMAAKALGVATIVAVDPVANRRATASAVGATAALDPDVDDVVDAIRGLTGAGATHALDTTGRPDVIGDGVDALAPCGVLAVVGVSPEEVPVRLADLMRGGKSLRGVTEGDAVPQEFLPRLLELHDNGQLPLEKLIEPYSFDEIDDAFAASADGSTIKPVLVF